MYLERVLLSWKIHNPIQVNFILYMRNSAVKKKMGVSAKK